MSNRTKIDEIDAKILKTLLKDSRTSFTKIAKDCKISIGAVIKRYKRMWKAGIINGEIMLFDPHALGFGCVVYLGITTTPEDREKVADFMINRPYKYIYAIGRFGKYDVFAIAVCHNIQEITKIVEDLESYPHIKRVESMIWNESVYLEHTENLNFGPANRADENQNSARLTEITPEKAQIDQIDMQIVKILAQSARTPFKKIAEQLSISIKNVIQRYKRLKGTVLTQATITIDLRKLGYKAFVYLFIKVANRGKMPEISSQLLKIPNLTVFLRLLGPYDLQVNVFVTDFEELFKAMDQIQRIPDINLIEMYITPVWEKWPPNIFTFLLPD